MDMRMGMVAGRWRMLRADLGLRVRAALLLLLTAGMLPAPVCAEDTPPRAESRPLPDPAKFAKQAFPLVGQYIFANYDEFASSKVS